ncbi:unnamed protein product [Blepharisma stoltei]|uniref:Uncharacterized protein n=1 Tax=Blepharisma stoltei TaxID=1481888 RepID=A0AAU9KST1_9CILI|nr:unnamed protein product [Blepharisma stoltei]
MFIYACLFIIYLTKFANPSANAYWPIYTIIFYFDCISSIYKMTTRRTQFLDAISQPHVHSEFGKKTLKSKIS